MFSSDSLSFFESIILGIVQGLTEFLPVSSDGHLVLARYFLNYQKDILVFDVLLHVGTLGSILVVFRKEIEELLTRTYSLVPRVLKQPPYLLKLTQSERWVAYIWLTTFITGVVGLLAEEQVEILFSSVYAAAFGFLITSVLLFAGSFRRHGRKDIGEFSWQFPFWIGLAQSAALLPGVSRSGGTIALALILGASKEQAGRFSFVAAVPIIFLASIYQIRHLFGETHNNYTVILVGVFTSFVTGIFAIRFLLWMLNKQTLYPFAIYTGLLGLIGLIFL